MNSVPQTLPASCYTSDAFLDVARKEIFEKGWHFIGLVSRYLVSDKEKFVQIGIEASPFFVACDIEDAYQASEVRAFFGEYEKLLQDVEESDLEKRLTQIERVNTVVTKTGLVFFTHERKPSKSFEEYFNGDELNNFIDTVDFRKYPLRRSLIYECDYSFMAFIDGYQECLHCTYTHPGLAKAYPLEFYKVEAHTNFARHLAPVDAGGEKDKKDGLFLYFFPTTAMNAYNGGIGCFRCSPISANKCRMYFDYYFTGSDEEFEDYFKFVRQVAEEDIELCETVQSNLQKGMYRAGCLNPIKEAGVVFYQNLIRQRVLNPA